VTKYKIKKILKIELRKGRLSGVCWYRLAATVREEVDLNPILKKLI